ncbi:Mitochondrial inheritance and actin cytoskeleton organization protein [Plasmopara halstedii]|uniref:Mitochondrial inheritance and actin cytoskeleton organization protein n=1 Tax=Plasmopara halstedii TaxID=4781 RepID=A0A0N7L417_PLAHL|nr:Mitochondrial inheritance and actin cytoskeleton organization protein [Plasmopara halstedii]CEG37427.1 Mitochondrial inheritance and actin cytoskeleton organization protein [Plasmopara halstedii]|eukprot:XP_024573796.1 Mitochondrial inheritance and actin cytoskeleton organization protein [Plasmopara halstedii]
MSDNAWLMARYVRPIYQAIDDHQYKNAIKLCSHKRVAHLDIVQVLKAHSLERTGRVEEALNICRYLQLKQPTDETLLNTMNLVFKLAGCEHEMLPTFEHACAVSNPPNEELFLSLFVSYARCSAFLKQQQTALKMFKAFGKIKYVCWAALSMMLQVEHGGAPARMLALAEKMLIKTLRETKSDDGEALQLVVLIMQLQGNDDGALETFDELVRVDDSKDKKIVTLGRAAEGEGEYDEEIELGCMQTIDKLSLEATLAKNVKNWKRCAAVNRKLLEEFNADDWTFLKDYIAARFIEKSDCNMDELLTLREELTEFLHDLASTPGNDRIRGPALAQIHVNCEILKRLDAEDAAISTAEMNLQENIVAYADRFHFKTCCFTDLKQYFTLYLNESSTFSSHAKSNLITYFVKMSTESAHSLKLKPTGNDVDDEVTRKIGQASLSKRLLALKSLRFLGFYDNVEHFSVVSLDHLVKELEDEYEATNWLNVGSAGGQREVQLTDDLLLLAAHTLLDIYQRSSGHRSYLERAAGLLEYGLEKSAYNFQMKLLLSRVYGYLGAAKAMLSRHAELDIKYVQLDSLSFLVLDKLLGLCYYPEAQKLTNRILSLHNSTAKDTPEYIARAYRLGVYSKVVDMSTFLHKRMKKSHTLAISKGETLRFELLDALALGPSKLFEVVTSSNFDAQVTDLENMLALDGAELSYNQHREVIVDWTAQPRIPTGAFFAQDDAPLVEYDCSADASSSLLWLKLRLLVPKLLKNLADDDHTTLFDLKNEYDDIVTKLHLIASENQKPQLHEKLWQWSSATIATSVQLVNSLSNNIEEQTDLSPAVMELERDFIAIVEQLKANMVFSAETTRDLVTFSPYAVSTMSSLLLDTGLTSLCVLALTQRMLMKAKTKKSEQLSASFTALRNLFKQMNESFTSLQTCITEIQITSPILSKISSSLKDQAMQKASMNVLKSQQSLQKRLIDLLKVRCASIRTILHK